MVAKPNSPLRAASLFLAPVLVFFLQHAEAASRERISINENWRFTKGDPTNLAVRLLYDVRPVQTNRRAAGAETNGAASEAIGSKDSTNPPAVIKQWILPT